MVVPGAADEWFVDGASAFSTTPARRKASEHRSKPLEVSYQLAFDLQDEDGVDFIDSAVDRQTRLIAERRPILEDVLLQARHELPRFPPRLVRRATEKIGLREAGPIGFESFARFAQAFRACVESSMTL